jgi:hypothetical protein
MHRKLRDKTVWFFNLKNLILINYYHFDIDKLFPTKLMDQVLNEFKLTNNILSFKNNGHNQVTNLYLS